ncbi:MAG TPA: MFS transporter [Stellaceae bacterium]|nr:MFS transporter [Stellaceae bacterium]
MTTERIVDVAALVDGRRLNWFSVRLVIFAFLIVVSDGFDINGVAYIGPQLIADWHIAPSDLTQPFVASLLGILVGAPVFGHIGDRHGRKLTIILALLIYGIFTWAATLCRSVPELTILRFLTGIGLGALFPNIIALVAEFAPRRLRGTMIILMFTGVSFGGATPGPIAAWLVPAYGWQILFTIGGVVPLLVAGVCVFGLPESVKYLTLKGKRDRVMRLLSAMRGDLHFTPETRFVIEGERQAARFSPRLLFAGRLALITPLLWLLFVINLMGYFFLISWTPTLLASAHLPPTEVAFANTAFQLGGVLGGWSVCRPMDRFGVAPLTLLFALAAPIIGAIGYLSAADARLMLAFVLLAGFCVLGIQFGINALSGMIYPTSFRSNGSGWAFAVGRIGSIAGLFIGGHLIALHIPIATLYIVAALPFLLGAVACRRLSRAYAAEFRGSAGAPTLLPRPLADLPPAQ